MDQEQASIGLQSFTQQDNCDQQQQDVQDTYNCLMQLQKDLQFVQMLSNPDYVIQLHQRGYLYDQKFLRYLDGLKYLNSQKYIVMMKYPQGLLNLERIKSKGFAQYLKSNENIQKFRKFCLDRNQNLHNTAH